MSDVTTEELMMEIRKLRMELQQMRDIVNSLVNIIVEVEGMDEELDVLLPDNPDNFLMYN